MGDTQATAVGEPLASCRGTRTALQPKGGGLVDGESLRGDTGRGSWRN